MNLFREGWPFAAVLAAGAAVFAVVRLLLPTGEESLPPLPLAPEPAPSVYSVALPAAPKPRIVHRDRREAVVVAPATAARPVSVAPKPKPTPKPRARVAAKPKPKPVQEPLIQLSPAEPAPEPTRRLASVAAPKPNKSPGRAKHDKGPPPGHAKKRKHEQPEPTQPEAPVVAEAPAPPDPSTSPGRAKHGKGPPPGQLKKD